MIILIHTSKTMRPAVDGNTNILATPLLISKTKELSSYMKTLSIEAIERTMHVSKKLATTTRDLLQSWTDNPSRQRMAIDSFLGDIYSGLQVQNWSQVERNYANEHLRILSGMYGVLKPLDGIFPYRLELGYKLPSEKFQSLYDFWGTSIVETLPKNELIVDLSAIEYGKTVTKYVDPLLLVSPRFLTISPKTGEPVFVAVHAKIVLCAFAS